MSIIQTQPNMMILGGNETLTIGIYTCGNEDNCYSFGSKMSSIGTHSHVNTWYIASGSIWSHSRLCLCRWVTGSRSLRTIAQSYFQPSSLFPYLCQMSKESMKAQGTIERIFSTMVFMSTKVFFFFLFLRCFC